MKLDVLISAVQAKLGVAVDGCAGTETWSAIYRQLVGPLPADDAGATGDAARADGAPADALALVDPRSEKAIATLQPEVRSLARALVHKAAQHAISIKIISGLRSYAEQDALYAQGRTASGPVVTNARGGYSNHNFGIAFDVGVFEGNRYLSSSVKYKAVGALGLELGLEWGGNWKTIVDEPHFQLRPVWATDLREATMLAELRRRHDSDAPIYA